MKKIFNFVFIIALMFILKINVYAESSDVYYWGINREDYHYSTDNFANNYNNALNFNYENIDYHLGIYNTITNYNSYYILLRYNNDIYLYSSYFQNEQSIEYIDFTIRSNSSDWSVPVLMSNVDLGLVNQFNYSYIYKINNDYSLTPIKQNSVLIDYLQNGEILQTNIDFNIKLNGELFYSNIPDNYVELDLNGKDGVYFWPKDLREIDNVCENETGSIVGVGGVCVYDKFTYKFYLKGALSYALSNHIYSMNQSSKIQLDIFDSYTEFNINIDRGDNLENIMFYNNYDLALGTIVQNNKIMYDSTKLNYQFIYDIENTDSFEMCTIDLNGNNICTEFNGVNKLSELDRFNVNEDSFDNVDFISYINDFLSNITNSFSFYKKQLKLFTDSIPGVVFAFVIIIPILVFIVYSWRKTL